MRLFHFSDDGSIDVFRPRAVRVPAKRAEGMDWLNGPLVWAIDEQPQPMYLFPRDCPRILLWPTEKTEQKDRPRALAESGVELRPLDSLTALRGVWETSLHASGISLRHAKDWHG